MTVLILVLTALLELALIAGQRGATHHYRAATVAANRRATIVEAEARRWRKLATTDQLTGLANRCGLHHFWMEATRAHRRPGWLVLVDLDHFKAINDTHGHQAGDDVLVEVARRLGGVSLATAGRTGGDEMVLLVDSRAQIDRLIPWLDDALRRPVQRVGQPPIAISASIGWAEVGAGDTQRDALAIADQAMYAAKHTGQPVQWTPQLPKPRRSPGRRAWRDQPC